MGIGVLGAVLGLAATALAAEGQLTFEDCFADTAGDGCTVPANAALSAARDVAVSPDGDSVYAVALGDDSLLRFDRASDGSLTYVGCFADAGTAGCVDIGPDVLTDVNSVTVSPDDESVYVTSDDPAVVAFDRLPGGSLSFDSCIGPDGACINSAAALPGPRNVIVSPDGDSAYVTSITTRSIINFDRDSSGTLTYDSCLDGNGGSNGCTEASPGFAPLGSTYGLAISPDGDSVYVGSAAPDGSITVFDRVTTPGPTVGDISFDSCFADAGVQNCADPPKDSLQGSFAVVVSPDGENVYIAGDDGAGGSVTWFERAPGGSLTYGNCWEDTGQDACATPVQQALDGASNLAITPDGRSVYVAASRDDSVSTFNRGTDGDIAFAGCFARTGVAGCQVPAQPALDQAWGLAISPDNADVYVASSTSSSLSRFSRELAAVPPPADPTPPPVEGQTETLAPVSGTVLVKTPGGALRPLSEVESLPVGTKVFAKSGRVTVTTEYNGSFQSMDFYDGDFQVKQRSSTDPVVTIALIAKVGCSAPKKRRTLDAPAQKSRRGGRGLWGSGGGKYRTQGKRGSATVRGTTWLTRDECDGSTRFKLVEGTLQIDDFGKPGKVNRTLRGKGSYTARPKGGQSAKT